MLKTNDAPRLLSRAFGTSEESQGGTRYVALAGDLGLRWIIPAELGAASRVLADWAPFNTKSRLAWKVVNAVSRIGALSLVPGARTMSVDLSKVDWCKYGWSKPEQPHVVSYVGTTGPRQKLVCTLIDRKTSRGVAVVKFPVGEDARLGILHEFDALVELDRQGKAVGPRPLLSDPDTGVTVQSYLDGKPDWVSIESHHVEFLAKLVHPTSTLSMDNLRERLKTRLDAPSTPPGARPSIEKLLAEGHWNGTHAAVRQHGDFAPWNLKRQHDGSVQAVDWEDSCAAGLPFFDLCYFHLSVTHRLRRSFSIPWQAYTNVLRRTTPTLTDEIASTLRTAVAIECGLSGDWAPDITNWDNL